MPKYRLLTPGPVAVPERVLLAMAKTLMHHRAPAFIPVCKEVRANLKKVFQTDRTCYSLASTGTGAMEAAQINTLSPGDRAVVVLAASSATGPRSARPTGSARERRRRVGQGGPGPPPCAAFERAHARRSSSGLETPPPYATRSRAGGGRARKPSG
jgi:hypothetical protein